MIVMLIQTLGTDGQKEKFIKMYRQYRNLMFYIAKDILHDDYLAEDAVHDAFVVLSKNFEKVREPISPETKRFVSVIVRNISINMAIKRNREAPVDDVASNQYYLSNYYDSTQDEFFSKYECRQIVEAVKGLPSTLKDPLLLYVAQELSVKEIAEVLNISPAATHKRIQRARARIMAELNKQGGHDEKLK